MAMNPMQRRATRSFVIGLVLGLMAAVAVAFFFHQQVKKLETELASIKKLQSTAYVAAADLESGAIITTDDITSQQVQTTVLPTEMIQLTDFDLTDDEGNLIEKTDKDGNPVQKEVMVKVNIPAGTIITKDMLAMGEKIVTKDVRMVEYSMINLPSEALEGDYVDIRLQFPEGQDYVVLGKKKIEKCTDTTIWIKQSEDDLLTLNNAIIDSYLAEGSKLYATKYTEPGIQDAAQQTYPVSREVLEVIDRNPNILEEAKKALADRYNGNDMVATRNNVINPSLGDPEDRASTVSSGISAEISSLQNARKEYLTQMGVSN